MTETTTEEIKSIETPPWFGVRVSLGRKWTGLISGALGLIGAIAGFVLAPHYNQMVERNNELSDVKAKVSMLQTQREYALSDVRNAESLIAELKSADERLRLYGDFLFYQQFRVSHDEGLVAVAQVTYVGEPVRGSARFVLDSQPTASCEPPSSGSPSSGSSSSWSRPS